MHKRFVVWLAIALCLVLAASGCASQGSQGSPTAAPTAAVPSPTLSPAAPVRIAALIGPTGMGLSYLMHQSELGEASQKYDFALSIAPDDVAAQVISGNTDIAAVPINLAATLYNKTEGGVKIIAINTLGVLYVLENGDSVKELSDLKGKTLYATGQGSTPEYILNYLLAKNNIADSVKIEYLAEHAELATKLAAGNVSLGMLPEPNATAVLMKNSALRIALDMTAEWNKISGGTQLVQGCFIVRSVFLEENPQAIKNFLADYQGSAKYVTDFPEQAAPMIYEYGILASPEAAQRAIPNCNIVAITGEDMAKNAKAMFDVLLASNPKSIGGALPGKDFYYMG
ncbi:MAG: ABC transporter substrate-binding protein [Bacillota bacterium]